MQAQGVRRVAFQCDPMERLKPATDTTLLLARLALEKGCEVFFYTPQNLTWREARITAMGHKVTLDKEGRLMPGAPEVWDLATLDVLWIRQDPPFDMSYLTPTYILDHLAPHVCVVNDQRALRTHPEKFIPLHFPDLMPATCITCNPQEALAFLGAHKEVVIKPLYGYAGRGIVRAANPEALEAFWGTSQEVAGGEAVILQEFLPQVFEGDRRFFLINGRLAGGFNKIPASQEFRANLGLGGTPHPLTPSQNEEALCARVGAFLKENNILFAGIDVVGEKLLEVNITSPTGIPAFNRLYKRRLEEDLWNALVGPSEQNQNI